MKKIAFILTIALFLVSNSFAVIDEFYTFNVPNVETEVSDRLQSARNGFYSENYF